ncbi:hypothetical protein F3Y22_tig00111983pilonHSYRG00015 [Hibiscus syriacus]|uniref:O-methyltransferase domain-containing protein n=1 Tax=Hibiscus syriacus TaxID=106335 RepID=A0A6A2XWK9_HIBSY|nr:hypothetical protein F3Y22_tig00111983pilonHSYRG00015 [Hibiscus syriacus]
MASSLEPHREVSGEMDNETHAFVAQLAMGSFLSMALKTACELGILEIIAKGGPDAKLYATDIAAKMPTKTNAGSFAPILALNQDKNFLDSWSHLKDAVLEGGTAFNRAHDGTSRNCCILIRDLTASSSVGITLHHITSKYPNIKGINFDLPHVIQCAPTYPGVEHVAGDMFESVPEGDAIFMKGILHNWSDEQCVRLLKNCYKVIPENGKVIVAEFVAPLMPESIPSVKGTFLLDVQMMTQFPGGKERTKE